MLQWPYLKVVFAVPDIFEVETTPKVEPGESFNDVWRFYGNFVNPAFKKCVAWDDITLHAQEDLQLLEKSLKHTTNIYHRFMKTLGILLL